jgi:hypothetical protein
MQDIIELWAPNLAQAHAINGAPNALTISALSLNDSSGFSAGMGSENRWFMGKGGMMRLCDQLCRKVQVVADTEIVRIERKPSSHLYTLFKKVRAAVSMRGAAALDSSVLARPMDVACGSFDAVLCCLPARAAGALMKNVGDLL